VISDKETVPRLLLCIALGSLLPLVRLVNLGLSVVRRGFLRSGLCLARVARRLFAVLTLLASHDNGRGRGLAVREPGSSGGQQVGRRSTDEFAGCPPDKSHVLVTQTLQEKNCAGSF
jgi:hypothetical protein